MVSVKFSGMAHDGRDFFALFTNGALSGEGPTRNVFESHYIPWLDSVALKRSKELNPVRCSFQDSDPAQYRVLESLRAEFNPRNIRVLFRVFVCDCCCALGFVLFDRCGLTRRCVLHRSAVGMLHKLAMNKMLTREALFQISRPTSTALKRRSMRRLLRPCILKSTPLWLLYPSYA